MKNKKYLIQLQKSIFWKVSKIAIVDELSYYRYKYKGKSGFHASASHEASYPHWHVWFRDMFVSKEQFKLLGKPGVAYIYVEEYHWLNSFLWKIFYGIESLFYGPLLNLIQSFIPKEMWNEEKDNWASDRPYQSKIFALYQIVNRWPFKYCVSKYLVRFRRGVFCIKPAKVTK